MTQLSDASIQEFKDILERKSGREMSWEEASEGAHRLAGLYDLLFKCVMEDERRKERLKESPKGFRLDGDGYSCAICGGSASREQSWYDKYGIKCMTCQRAIDRKLVPATAAKFRESWYSVYDIESRFGLDRHALRRFIKQGILKPRTIPNDTGRVHAQIFLIRDNKDTLPPKKLTESQLVKETRDGKDWFHSEPWYRFVDPHVAMKGYKIMNHLRMVPLQPAVKYTQI